VQRIWKMHESIAKPRVQQEGVDRLPSQTDSKEEVATLRERNEVLERENVYRRLTAEGDALTVYIAEHEMAKIHPETYQRFRQYCEREHLSTFEALRKMGITAFSLFVSFPDWYTLHASNEEFKLLGMEALKWEVTLEVDAFLRAKDAKERETQRETKGKAQKRKQTIASNLKHEETPEHSRIIKNENNKADSS